MSASFPLALIGRGGFVGVIGVDMIGEIRRAYFEQHWPIKEIVRTLSVSRATVRKVVRSHKTEFKYERGSQPAPKLGEWVEVLTELLGKEAKLPRRERRSIQRLFEELRGRGYDGAHDSVHRFVRAWRNERARVPAHAYGPMGFAAGEAYQFDWSHETITLQNLPLTIKAAHMKLSHSRMPFVRGYFRETQELVFDAHDKAFQFHGGACRRGGSCAPDGRHEDCWGRKAFKNCANWRSFTISRRRAAPSSVQRKSAIKAALRQGEHLRHSCLKGAAPLRRPALPCCRLRPEVAGVPGGRLVVHGRSVAAEAAPSRGRD